ncbi:MAG TPA: YfcE family phosphodiesterase [Candidatus Bathyarchaeota archaeon]|nr:YfcE family phosphodiesterase [Candidatus Bathyarchaeota archaeon]
MNRQTVEEKIEGDVKIVAISDTHIPDRAKSLPEQCMVYLKDADFIFHAGDITSPRFLESLREYGKVYAVRGNMDPPELSKLPEFLIVSIGSVKIGMVHRVSSLGGKQYALNLMDKNDIDLLIYGHTHRPSLYRRKGFTLLNPGSPTIPIPPFIIKPSIAIVTIRSRETTIKMVKLG